MNQYNGGRLTKFSVRISSKELQKLKELLKNSPFASQSDFVRFQLFGTNEINFKLDKILEALKNGKK
ncbi:MAG TPA: hypothetical protein P5277_02605 [Candidatus Paceibacterota bacterium]|nr:hypothetical protein [Candidatus Paceibacterota bacterium]